MAKLNTDGWNDRQRSASALADEEDEAFLRPAAPAAPRRKGAPELVPNYDAGDAEQFLRVRRKAAPRRGWTRRLLATRVGQVLLALAVLLALGVLGFLVWQAGLFLHRDPHFRIDSSASIEAAGNTELRRAELLEVFGSDIGRNIFFVPLAKREAALEGEPWVKHATVMRLLPKTLRVTVVERVPVAFVRLGRQIGLVDAEGVLLPMAPATLAARHYSFPVVAGLDPGAPSAARSERMHLYQGFVSALGPAVASELSEVDVSDLEDVRAVVPAQGSDLLLHFGNSDYVERWRSYREHLPEWRQQYPNLSAVDLRYDRQVVLKMADAAVADEAREARQAQEVKHAALKPAVKPAPKPRPVVKSKPPAKPAPRTAQARPGTAKTWYTEKAGPHHGVRWVPHTLPGGGKR